MNYWVTKEGVNIPYKEIKNSHLLNILKWIRYRAKKGMTIINCGGSWDVDDIWFDEYEIEGQEVFDRYDYKGLLKEAKQRKLKI